MTRKKKSDWMCRVMGAKWGKNSGTRGQETTSMVVATRALSLQVKNISNYLASILLLIVLCLSSVANLDVNVRVVQCKQKKF